MTTATRPSRHCRECPAHPEATGRNGALATVNIRHYCGTPLTGQPLDLWQPNRVEMNQDPTRRPPRYREPEDDNHTTGRSNSDRRRARR